MFNPDFYQLPLGIGASAKLLLDRPSARANAYTREGYRLWHESINQVAELWVNVRASNDPVWQQLLARFRVGQPASDDWALLQERQRDVATNSEELNNSPLLATYTNTGKDSINDLAFLRALHRAPAASSHSWRQRRLICIEAGIERKNSRLPIPQRDKEWVLNRSPKDFDKKMIPRLNLAIGGPVICTQNTLVTAGIANGTRGRVVDVLLRPNAPIRLRSVAQTTYPDIDLQVHTVSSRDMIAVIVRHDSPAWQRPDVFPSLPTGCFPVHPVSSNDNGTQIRGHAKTFDMHGERVRLHFRQVDLLPRWGLHPHWTQMSRVNGRPARGGIFPTKCENGSTYQTA